MAPKRKAAAKSVTGEEGEAHVDVEHIATEAPEAESAAPPTAEETHATEATPAAAAAEAEPEVPYTPLPVGGSTTEIYGQLQTILAADSAKINYYLPQLLELVQASESIETPILLRVRFVEFVGNHVAQVRDNNALRKIVTSLVKIVGGEDNTPQLLTAAVQAFAGLGPVSVVDKNWEYLAREGADVLMQVMLDSDAFPETVRTAAGKALNALTKSAFRSVLAKLLHWLSLDREDDAEEQIQKERHLALTRLLHLVNGQGLRQHWSEETEKFAEPLLQRVMGTVDRREFAQLARICAFLPVNKSKGNLPLLEWYLGSHQLNDERNRDAVAIIGRHVSATAEYDMTPALEAAGLLSQSVQGAEESSVDAAKVLLLASRLATPEAAEKLYSYIYAQVEAMMTDMRATLTTCNLATVEAVLFAAVVLARKRPAEVLQKLNDDAFNASATAAAAAAAAVAAEVVFAVKKAAVHGGATPVHADAAASLHNIKTILEAFAAKRLPLGELRESWVGGNNRMPTVKRGRDEAGGALPPPPGSQAAADKSRSRTPHQQDSKRQRNERHGSNGNNSQGRHNNRSQSSNNRSQSSGNRNDRRPRRDGRR